MNNQVCSVRARQPADLDVLADVLRRVHAVDGYPVEGVGDPIGWLNHADELKSWTAEIEDRPIGQVTLAKVKDDEDAAKVWRASTGGAASHLAAVVRLFVDPDWRHAGAGRGLMMAALDYARLLERTVVLDVMVKDRAAISLYERLGARQIGEIAHRYGNDLTEPAAVFEFPAD